MNGLIFIALQAIITEFCKPQPRVSAQAGETGGGAALDAPDASGGGGGAEENDAQDAPDAQPALPVLPARRRRSPPRRRNQSD